MMMESLEHMVRSRVRMFLRHTWLVAILGTILIGAMIWAGFYYASEREHLRVAASPTEDMPAPAVETAAAKPKKAKRVTADPVTNLDNVLCSLCLE